MYQSYFTYTTFFFILFAFAAFAFTYSQRLLHKHTTDLEIYVYFCIHSFITAIENYCELYFNFSIV